jgi:hypothetical protein
VHVNLVGLSRAVGYLHFKQMTLGSPLKGVLSLFFHYTAMVQHVFTKDQKPFSKMQHDIISQNFYIFGSRSG